MDNFFFCDSLNIKLRHFENVAKNVGRLGWQQGCNTVFSANSVEIVSAKDEVPWEGLSRVFIDEAENEDEDEVERRALHCPEFTSSSNVDEFPGPKCQFSGPQCRRRVSACCGAN